ncbi:GNAT family N-acetyltransferase [Nocardia aurea]|uniref:GNAT family N-acetyltransferase n=1 Tax=Nocardia aurea TaxID=2144174 RepID=A0ABV3FU26_9NOCA
MAKMEQELFADLAYPDHVLRQLFDLHGSHWVVADSEGVILGYAVVGIDSNRCAWVMGLGVAGASRGLGLGHDLLERAMENCRAARVERVRITVRPDNTAAAELYRRAGFDRIGYEENYFGTGDPRDILERRLGNRRPRWGGPEADDPRWIKHPPWPLS